MLGGKTSLAYGKMRDQGGRRTRAVGMGVGKGEERVNRVGVKAWGGGVGAPVSQ